MKGFRENDSNSYDARTSGRHELTEGAVSLIETAEGELAYLPRELRIATDSANRLMFSLTLVLAREPRVDETDLWNLIDRGVLSFTVSLRLPEDSLKEAFDGKIPRAAFARNVRFSLVNQAGQTVAETRASGPAACGGLSTNMDATASRSVLRALAGEPSGFVLRAEVTTSGKPDSVTVSIEAAWVDFFDALSSLVADDPVFGLDKVNEALRAMRLAGKIRIRIDQDAPLSDDDIAAVLLTAARRSAGVIVARVDSISGGHFRLQERPVPNAVWQHRETISRPRVVESQIATPLEKAVGISLSDTDWTRYVQVLSQDGNSGMLSPLLRRNKGLAIRGERNEHDAAPQSMAVIGNSLVSVESVATTHQPAIKPRPISTNLQQFLLQDSKLNLTGREKLLSLPVVVHTTDTFFKDRLNPNQVWYVPQFVLLQPSLTDIPEKSPFEFCFERTGITENGDVAIGGTLRLTLCQKPAATTQQALSTMPGVVATPVPILDLSLHLSIPYIDINDNSVRRLDLRGDVNVQQNMVTAKFQLANRWLRLAYSVLSTEGFQGNEQARVEYGFRYACYRPVEPQNITSIFGAKSALLPIRRIATLPVPRESLSDTTALTDITGIAIRFDESEFDQPVTSHQVRSNVAPFLSRPSITLSRPIPIARPIDPTVIRPLPIEIDPPLADLKPLLPTKSYAQQSVGVLGQTIVSFPCNVFGTYYRQRFPEGWKSIGCQDALKLGQISSRIFEELSELAGPWMRVFRNLPQPGRFLILPRTLRISRYPPGHDREYLPAAVVYAVLDSSSSHANRYRFVATLEPDIPLYALSDLRHRLIAYAPKQTIQFDFPMELADTVELPSMPLASQFSPPAFTVTPTGIQLSIECPLPDALVLRRAIESLGILGQLQFTFSDGTRLSSNLELHLAQIVGPWNIGPIQVSKLPGRARLTNRIENPVDVADAAIFAGGAAVGKVSVNQRLESGHSTEVECDDSSEVIPIYVIPPIQSPSLEESRIYIEDVSINVVFTCGISFESRSIAELLVFARLKDGSAEQQVNLLAGIPRVGEAKFTVLLSTFAAGETAVAEYRVVRVMKNGDRFESPWTDCRGAVVDLQWETIT